MKKITIILAILSLDYICFAQFAGGTGTVEDPYQISTAEQLNNVRNYKTSSFIQTADIDLGVAPWNLDEGWRPIGDYDYSDPSKSFRGNYDGGEYKISNMSIKYPTGINSAGLFASTEGCEIKNINLLNFDIRAYGGSFGGLIGYSYLDNISNVTVEGRLEGYSDMGLLAHFFEGYNIINCHAKGEIISTGGGWIGGLISMCNADSIINCSVEAKISSNKNMNGGFIAYCIDTEIIDNCSAIIDMKSESGYWIGGFVGGSIVTSTNNTSITNSFSSGKLFIDPELDSESIGGFIGSSSGDVISALNIKNCYSTVDVTGNNFVGGFIGRAYDDTAIENCYSTGQVNGTTNVGGLVGYIVYPETVSVTNSYWDMETAGVDSSAAGEGRTTAEMKLPYGSNTYIDWDFVNVWRDDVIYQNNGYPTFLWVSGIEDYEDDFVTLARGFELYQNYPNPFNPVTNIKFALRKAGKVELAVYNIAGQLVRKVIDKEMTAGYHSIKFEADNLNSGVYFYKLKAGGKEFTKKMLMVK